MMYDIIKIKKDNKMNINEVNKKVLDEYGVEFNIEDWIGKSKGCFKILVNENMKVEYVDKCDFSFDDEMFEEENREECSIFVKIN